MRVPGASPVRLGIPLVLALFYKGLDLVPFAIALSFGICLLATALAQAWERLRFPASFLTFTMLGLCLWLGLSVLWSQVPYISAINFWAVGGLPIIYFGYLLALDPEALWRRILPFVTAVGLVLCGYGCYEYLALDRLPQAVFANRNNLAAYLNLVALLTGAWFLTRARRTGRDPLFWAAAGTLALHFFTVSLIGSRGAYLGLLAGLVLLCAVALRQSASRRRILALPALFAGAFTAAHLVTKGFSGARLATLADPLSADSQRFVIWESAWRMWQETPWYGTGIGAFWFGWQPFRAAVESSAGFFAHNDYLQILIEAGWPGLLLLLAAMGAALRLLVLALRQPDIDRPKKVELTGAFAGIGAVALHTFFTFNFYILSVLMLCGLALGRFHFLAAPAAGRTIELRPARFLKRPIYRLLVFLLALFPLSYFIAVGLSYHNYTSGMAELQKGDYQLADEHLQRAVRYWDAPDVVWFARADLYRKALRRLPADSQDERATLFRQAIEYLDKAEARNPLRPKIYTIRGLLLRENPHMAGEEWKEAAEAAFNEALQVDPRHLPARLAYADLLTESEGPAAAHRLMEQGTAYSYPRDPLLLSYYKRLELYREQVGDSSGAREMAEKIEALRSHLLKRS